MSNGFLYVITSSCGNVKVGVSKRPNDRLKQIRTSNLSAKLYFTSVEVGNSYQIESEVHSELERYSVGGEWFSCSKDDAVSAIRKNVELCGISPRDIALKDDELKAEEKMHVWKINGCSLELVSMNNSGVVERYLEIDKSDEFAMLSHEQQYLIASTNFANAFINAHMNCSKEVKQ